MENFEDYVIYAIKIFYMCLCVIYIFAKLTTNKLKNKSSFVFLISMVVAIVLLCVVTIKIYVKSTLANIIIYFGMSFLIGVIFERNNRMIGVLVSFAIYYIFFALAVVISFFIEFQLQLKNKIIAFCIIAIIHQVLICIFFNIRRFRNGFSFLKRNSKNEYIDGMMLSICSIVLLLYSLITFNVEITSTDRLRYTGEDITKYLFSYFIIFGVIMLIMIRKTLVLSYKQQILSNTLKDYENTIKEKDKKIEKLSDEKFKINKLNHEFYNRQKSLELKVEEAIKNMNFEISNEIDLGDKILELSKEYTNKVIEIKNDNKLPKTEIEEIDDMFKYMQSECTKNGIEFILQVNGNIHYLINNIINKTKLVTLIGDHLRDAIIAINHSDNKYKNILAILGIKDDCYEFCIYDSGIEFEIEIFNKLGIEPITTHKDSGGTGIGFITTFETLRETNASLIIEEKNELTENKYTKLVKFKFDNKNELKIVSYRAKDIKAKLENNRFIIE